MKGKLRWSSSCGPLCLIFLVALCLMLLVALCLMVLEALVAELKVDEVLGIERPDRKY